MRKIIICLSLLILLTSCKSAEEIKPKTQNLRFTLHTVWNKTEYILNGETDDISRLFLSVTSPKGLENFKISSDFQSVKINYLDLEKEIPLKAIEEDSPLRVIFEGIKSARTNTEMFEKNEEFFTEFSLKSSNYRFVFTESGLPISIKGENNNLIIFKGLQVLK